MRADSGFCVAPSALNQQTFVLIHALTGVAIEMSALRAFS